MLKYFLSVPHRAGSEEAYIRVALNENVIGPADSNITQFEDEFKKYLGRGHVAALSSGSSAMHLLLVAYGIKPKDIVLCQSLTFVGSVAPILYTGATPVFIDSDEESLNMSSFILKKSLKKYKPKAVIIVNLFGTSANYYKLVTTIRKYSPKTIIIEDAAESLGSTFRDRKSGTLCDAAVFSFNTNKIITTGGGGMAYSKNKKIIDKIKFLSTQSKDKDFYYKHSTLSFNYRMNNIAAGTGRAQLKDLERRVKVKRKIHKWYLDAIKKYDSPFKMYDEPIYGTSNHWLNVIFFSKDIVPDKVNRCIKKTGIELRGVWRPMHKQPFYKKYEYVTDGIKDFSGTIYKKGLCVPSDIDLKKEDVDHIVKTLTKIELTK